MKKIVSLVLVLLVSFPVFSQRGNDARGYFKDFTSESRRISRKNYLYLEASVKASDPRRISRYREMVVEQLQESAKAMQRKGPYKEDDVLVREYRDALDMYLKAFGEQFKEADSLNEYKFNSYKDLLAYYEVLEEAELNMIDASYKIDEAEEYFAKRYDVQLRRDEEAEEQFRLLDEATLYARDMTKAFFRVDAQAQLFLAVANRGNTDSLVLVVKNMRDALDESQNQVGEYQNRELEYDFLQKEVSYYLEDMQEEVSVKLQNMAEDLANVYLDEDEFEDAKDELERFSSRVRDYREEFFESRQDLIERYLPE